MMELPARRVSAVAENFSVRAGETHKICRMHSSHKHRVTSLLVWVLLCFCLGTAIVQRAVEANSDANRLYEDLMMSYNRFVRPVQNDSDTLVVKLGLKLSQLIDVVSSSSSSLECVVLGREPRD